MQPLPNDDNESVPKVKSGWLQTVINPLQIPLPPE
jgi:hypothetical protein